MEVGKIKMVENKGVCPCVTGWRQHCLVACGSKNILPHVAPPQKKKIATWLSRWKRGVTDSLHQIIFLHKNEQKRRDLQFTPLLIDRLRLPLCVPLHSTFTTSICCTASMLLYNRYGYIPWLRWLLYNRYGYIPWLGWLFSSDGAPGPSVYKFRIVINTSFLSWVDTVAYVCFQTVDI